VLALSLPPISFSSSGIPNSSGILEGWLLEFGLLEFRIPDWNPEVDQFGARVHCKLSLPTFELSALNMNKNEGNDSRPKLSIPTRWWAIVRKSFSLTLIVTFTFTFTFTVTIVSLSLRLSAQAAQQCDN
jgi:hypothetical protein